MLSARQSDPTMNQHRRMRIGPRLSEWGSIVAPAVIESEGAVPRQNVCAHAPGARPASADDADGDKPLDAGAKSGLTDYPSSPSAASQGRANYNDSWPRRLISTRHQT